ncbi:lytic murein transglycosylase [Entomobacter blattae]|uniref:Tn3 family transposase TnXax1 n=1 Tax=Entomobacter blattae TaxID=2762277 RepID=A0A7H1NT18_9PROT|nr:lytic murein transglycosylase [Entomobacter blattae]QNT78928.1 Tn3 family transposase TnXax1 [Entomobacter blattae]
MITRRNLAMMGIGAGVGLSVSEVSGKYGFSQAYAKTLTHSNKGHTATKAHKSHHSSNGHHYNGDYAQFLNSVRSEALSKGYNAAIIDQALNFTAPNDKVLQLDRHQPEFTMTWAQYRSRVLPESKLKKARQAYSANQDLVSQVTDHYPADPGVILGIWGVESAFGTKMGTFHVIDALATLSYAGRRTAFFHSELMKALKILSNGDTVPQGMFGSYAGAMGQPQFMPSAYLRYAVDFDGDGKRNIWTSRADSLASVANYLVQCGWNSGEPWGEPITVPSGFSSANTGRKLTRSVEEWANIGVRPVSGEAFRMANGTGAVLMPDGVGGEAFMVYHNFNVIRRYNPSDFYALGVGLMGDSATVS